MKDIVSAVKRAVLPQFKSILVSELSSKGFTEDPTAKEAFDRRIWLRCLPFVVVFFASGILALMHKVAFNLAFLAGMTAVAGILAVLLAAYREPVLSRHTGKAMMKYKHARDDDEESSETVYVCPDSKTYFTRQWSSGAAG